MGGAERRPGAVGARLTRGGKSGAEVGLVPSGCTCLDGLGRISGLMKGERRARADQSVYYAEGQGEGVGQRESQGGLGLGAGVTGNPRF